MINNKRIKKKGRRHKNVKGITEGFYYSFDELLRLTLGIN